LAIIVSDTSPIRALANLAKQRGFIVTVAPQIDRLERELGFFISASLRVEILTTAGEI
jgi:predicted nucleic acid-binding protein